MYIYSFKVLCGQYLTWMSPCLKTLLIDFDSPLIYGSTTVAAGICVSLTCDTDGVESMLLLAAFYETPFWLRTDMTYDISFEKYFCKMTEISLEYIKFWPPKTCEWEEKSRYLLVWVGLWYTDVWIDSFSWWHKRTSRKGRQLSVTISTINCICGLTWFRCWWKEDMVSTGRVVHVSEIKCEQSSFFYFLHH